MKMMTGVYRDAPPADRDAGVVSVPLNDPILPFAAPLVVKALGKELRDGTGSTKTVQVTNWTVLDQITNSIPMADASCQSFDPESRLIFWLSLDELDRTLAQVEGPSTDLDAGSLVLWTAMLYGGNDTWFWQYDGYALPSMQRWAPGYPLLPDVNPYVVTYRFKGQWVLANVPIFQALAYPACAKNRGLRELGFASCAHLGPHPCRHFHLCD
jgi:hypothetical protein